MDLQSVAAKAAQANNIPTDFFLSLLGKGEGGFVNPTGVSPKGATGPAQLMPGTARDMGVTDPSDPVQNIYGGAKYAGQLWKKYGGDPVLTAAAYNAGPGAVDSHGGVPPYKETQAYVQRVVDGMQPTLPSPDMVMGHGQPAPAAKPTSPDISVMPSPDMVEKSYTPPAPPAPAYTQTPGYGRARLTAQIAGKMMGDVMDSPLTRAMGVVPGPPLLAAGQGVNESFMQGALANFGDEAQGAIAAGSQYVQNAIGSLFGAKPQVTPADAFHATTDEARARQGVFAKAHPVVSAGANIMGAAVPAVAAAGATAPAFAWRGGGALAPVVAGAGRLAQATTIGATQGALSAYGEAQGDPAQRLPATASGAATGAALGAVFGLGGEVAGLAGRGVSMVVNAAKNAGSPGEDVIDSLAEAAKIDPAAARGDIETMIDQKAAEAKPLFDAALQPDNPRPLMNRDLAQLAQEPEVQSALKTAQRLVGKSSTVPGIQIDPETGTPVIGDGGKPVMEMQPTPQTWDVARKMLNKSIAKDAFGNIVDSGDQGVANTFRLRYASNLTKALAGDETGAGAAIPGLRDALDKSGEYLSARSAFKNAPKTFFNAKVSSDEFASTLQDMSEGEQDAAKAGVVNEIYNRAQNNRNLGRTLTSPAMMGKLRALLGEDADSFITALQQEAKVRALKGVAVAGGKLGAAVVTKDPINALFAFHEMAPHFSALATRGLPVSGEAANAVGSAVNRSAFSSVLGSYLGKQAADQQNAPSY